MLAFVHSINKDFESREQEQGKSEIDCELSVCVGGGGDLQLFHSIHFQCAKVFHVCIEKVEFATDQRDLLDLLQETELLQRWQDRGSHSQSGTCQVARTKGW